MASSLVKQGIEALGPNATHIEIAEWACIAVKMRVKASSWAAYKSAHKADITNTDELKIVTDIYREKGKLAKGERRQVKPSKRMKNVSEEQQQKLMTELKRPIYGQWAKPARIWFTALTFTGMRPKETADAEIIIIDGLRWLRVKNLKVISPDADIATRGEITDMQGRNTGIYRNIPLNHLTNEQIEIVAAQCAIAKKMTQGGIYKSYYDGVRMLIANAGKKLWPDHLKRPTLYTGRHTYKDRTKAKLLADGYSTSEVEILIAALMGHGSKKTQYAYGTGNEELIEQEVVMTIKELMNAKDALLRNIISEID